MNIRGTRKQGQGWVHQLASLAACTTDAFRCSLRNHAASVNQPQPVSRRTPHEHRNSAADAAAVTGQVPGYFRVSRGTHSKNNSNIVSENDSVDVRRRKWHLFIMLHHTQYIPASEHGHPASIGDDPNEKYIEHAANRQTERVRKQMAG